MPAYLLPPYSYFILGLLILILFLARISFKPNLKGGYSKKSDFATHSELEAYWTIKNILPSGYVIFPQINIDKILNSNEIGDKYLLRASRSRIDRKSVDFVIFDEQYLKPILAIELDDFTHLRFDRQKRDNFVNQIFAEANFSLLRINLADIRNTEEFKNRLLLEIYPKETQIS